MVGVLVTWPFSLFMFMFVFADCLLFFSYFICTTMYNMYVLTLHQEEIKNIYLIGVGI